MSGYLKTGVQLRWRQDLKKLTLCDVGDVLDRRQICNFIYKNVTDHSLCWFPWANVNWM